MSGYDNASTSIDCPQCRGRFDSCELCGGTGRLYELKLPQPANKPDVSNSETLENNNKNNYLTQEETGQKSGQVDSILHLLANAKPPAEIIAGTPEHSLWNGQRALQSEFFLRKKFLELECRLSALEKERDALRALAIRSFLHFDWFCGEGYGAPESEEDADQILMDICTQLGFDDVDTARIELAKTNPAGGTDA